MKITLRKKIFILFCIFMAANGLIWFTGYYINHLLKQKLQIIDKKTSLLNTILEARRYEKNFFLTGDAAHLDHAIDYIGQAGEKFRRIIGQHGQYTLTRNFGVNLKELEAYQSALITLRDACRQCPEPSVTNAEVGNLGRKITDDIDKIVTDERRYAALLLNRSQLGMVVSVGALVLLTVLAILFLFFNVNKPLKSIEEAIRKIARGDYTSIPALNTGDEFESLVTSLNAMIGEMNRRSEHLVQMEKLASLGTLTSGVAHELNNPLNNISTSVQIVLEELEDPDLDFKRELLVETERQVERSRDIVRGLLEFSRQSTFNRRPVNLKDLMDKTIQLIKSEVPAGVEILLDISDSIRARLDPQRFQQMLINLITNGVHAMDQGGQLTIRARADEKRGGFVLEISDTGCGIEEEHLSKIFDPFFTTKEVGKGSGLGLSITHGIVEQHGGGIQVKSRVGSGTTFTIFLPIGEDTVHG